MEEISVREKQQIARTHSVLGARSSGPGFTTPPPTSNERAPSCWSLTSEFSLLSLTKEASLAALGESWKGLRSCMRSLQLLQKCALPAGLVPLPAPLLLPGI